MKRFDIPILFVIFNKLDSAMRVFEEIKRVKPKELFIVADGPRNKEEKKITDRVRREILKKIDWSCKIKKKFRNENWGGNKSSVEGLDWFFENVEYGIFLEDDCLPSKTFFEYHKELLLKYKEEKRIKAITGVNFLSNYKMKDSYLFSQVYFSCWGFSTWKRAWRIDREFIRRNYKKGLTKAFPNFIQRLSVKKHLKKGLEGGITNWDYLFATQNALKKGLTIVPSVNLVENIGFSGNSTHEFDAVDKKYLSGNRQEFNFPLKHPNQIKNNKRLGNCIDLWILKRILKKIWERFFKNEIAL